MSVTFPAGIRAEIVCNYLEGVRKEISFRGTHKRNVYEDILSVSQEEDVLKIELSKPGMYDILPEALFHPVDRFDNIPANEYKERFAEEVEEQRREEANARSYFSLYDRFLFGLSSAVVSLKSRDFNDNRVLSDIICDSLPERYSSNRFVARTMEFMPRCRSIRGNETLLTLMLRKIMADEGLKLTCVDRPVAFEDEAPRYNCRLRQQGDYEELYLGNRYDEDMLCYEVQYWDEDSCNETFLNFVAEIGTFRDFLNDYFMGIETSLSISVSTDALPIRLSDEMCFNYLNYNTNL